MDNKKAIRNIAIYLGIPILLFIIIFMLLSNRQVEPTYRYSDILSFKMCIRDRLSDDLAKVYKFSRALKGKKIKPEKKKKSKKVVARNLNEM